MVRIPKLGPKVDKSGFANRHSYDNIRCMMDCIHIFIKLVCAISVFSILVYLHKIITITPLKYRLINPYIPWYHIYDFSKAFNLMDHSLLGKKLGNFSLPSCLHGILEITQRVIAKYESYRTGAHFVGPLFGYFCYLITAHYRNGSPQLC